MATESAPFSNHAAILITGAAGFIGRNLCATLRAQGWQNLLEYDMASPEGALEDYAQKADFVFHLAGVNRPQNPSEFYTGNADLTTRLLRALRAANSPAPLVLTSSAQAGNGTDYAKSKQAAEDAALRHGQENNSPVYTFRLPGVFGKWSRPAYNSVVATFCHNTARGLPIQVRDADYAFPLCYIDDVVAAFLSLLGTGGQGSPAAIATLAPQIAGTPFYTIAPSYTVTLGWLADTINAFAESRKTLSLPDMQNEITKKLWATYLSFLPQAEYAYPLAMHTDQRGSFTEFLRTEHHGQVSVNVAKPGVAKGNHWHNTKNEKFLVVSGTACIRFRALGTNEVTEYTVNGGTLQVVDIPPGSTHNIQNIGDGDLVTVMWASEPFDPENPDTYYEEV